MNKRRIPKPVAAGALALAALACAASLSARSGNAHEFALGLLSAHNAEREAKGVPPLRWSAQLAKDAEPWAQELARRGRLVHAPKATRNGAGENLWAGYKGRETAQKMVGDFLAERKDFRAGIFPHVSKTGYWKDVGHYSQIIWPDTREVGCAVAEGEHWDFLVCRYYPAGNQDGKRVG